ncbi:MAG: hypothetical protein NVS9B14_03930 [Candidatus Acidiferrum sp.]
MSARKNSFVRKHSLSLASGAILLLWVVMYRVSNEHTHIGSFFGNAIADWLGMLVTVLASHHLYEKGSSESAPLPKTTLKPVWEFLRDHSLTIFLAITGIGWVIFFAKMDSESKWGQVVGNIVSEWTQIFGLVLLTKKLIEKSAARAKKSG